MTERIEADVTDGRHDRLAERFEADRTIRAVAYGMIGSVSGADDSVQEHERISELDLMGLGA